MLSWDFALRLFVLSKEHICYCNVFTADIQCGPWIPMFFPPFFSGNASVTWLANYVECWARKLNLILMLSATRGGHCLSRTQLCQFNKSLMVHRLQPFQNKRSFVISRLHVAENWGKSLRKQLRAEKGRGFML